MNYKLIGVLVIILALFTTSYGCVYMEDHSSCDFITSQGSNIISIDISQISEYQEISASIQFPSGESSKLEFLEESSSSMEAIFFQKRVFDEFGVYKLNLNVVLEDGISTLSKNYNILYDNSIPLPPVVTSIEEDESNSQRFVIEGFINNPILEGEVVAFVNGVKNSVMVSSDGSFSISLQKSQVNRIELIHRISRSGSNMDSSKFKYIFYSQEIQDNAFSFVNVARVGSVNFISDNPLTSQTPSRITTFTPHYHISGTATEGNVVFIQGVPIPVVDGVFQTYVLLNEGEDNLCVVGTNQVCRNFNTIYSHANPQTLLSFSDKSQLKTLDINTLTNEKLVSKLIVQGEETQRVNLEPTVTNLDRNLFLIELMLPGVYESQYILLDNEAPEIEILASEILFRDSKIGILLKDDTRVDLNSFILEVGGSSYSYEDATRVSLNNRVSYLEFNVPHVVQSNPRIVASIRDIEGRSSSVSKNIELIQGTLSSPNLNVEVLSGGKKIGNRVYVSSDTSTLRFKFTNKNPMGENLPISTGVLKLDNILIESYTINSNNELILELDVKNLNNLTQLELNFNLYDSFDNPSIALQPEFKYEIYPIEKITDSSKTHRVIAKNVDLDNLVIVELLSNYVDYSTLSVPSGVNLRVNGNYAFINLNDRNSANVNYLDLSGNSYTFQVTSNSNTNVRIDRVGSSNLYSTFKLISNRNYHFFDSIFNNKDNSGLTGTLANTNVHLSPLYLEGLSRSTISIYDSSNRDSISLNTPINQKFSFSNYPTIQNPDGGEIFYRGLKQYVSPNQQKVVVQGRVLGNEEIAIVTMNGVNCNVEERFFVCELDRSNYVGRDLVPRFYDSGGEEVIIAYNTIQLRFPKGIIDFGTSMRYDLNVEAFYISNTGTGDPVVNNISHLISCNRFDEVENFNFLLNNGVLEISRSTTNSVVVNLDCDVSYQSISASSVISGYFREISEDELLILNTPTLLSGGDVESIGPVGISAKNYRGQNLTNSIVCVSSSLDIDVVLNNGELRIDRVVNSSISTSVHCSVIDSLNGNSRNNTISISFDRIYNPQSLVLQTPSILSGAQNQQVLGKVTGVYNMIDISSQIACSSSNPQVLVRVEGGKLIAQRGNNNSLVSEVTCSLSRDGYEKESKTIVLFDLLDSFTPSYELYLDVPNYLNGAESQKVQDLVGASDSQGNDLTNSIICQRMSLSENIHVSQSNSPLIVERLHSGSIDTFIQCSVSNNGLRVERFIQIMFERIESREGELSIYAQSPLNGRENSKVIGSIEGRLDGDLILTSTITCNNVDSSLYDYTIDGTTNTIEITRNVPSIINSNLECSLSKIDGSETKSVSIRVLFDAQQGENPVRINFNPSTLNTNEMLISTKITATRGSVNVLDEVSCRVSDEFRTRLNVDLVDSSLIISRNNGEKVENGVIICSHTPTGRDIKTLSVNFLENLIPMNHLHLNTPLMLSGAKNQEIIGEISAVYNDNLVSHLVSCTSTNNNIRVINTNNNVMVQRQSNSEINSVVNCGVSVGGLTNSSSILVTFDRINEYDSSYELFLEVPTFLSGGDGDRVQSLISASNSDGTNLTSSVSCQITDSNSKVRVVSENSPLIIQRDSEDSIHSVVRCSISDNGFMEVKYVQISFDKIEQESTSSLSITAQSPLFGGMNSQVIGEIRALLNEVTDVTNNIVCTTSDSSLYRHEISPSSNRLIITRLTTELIESSLRCSISDLGGENLQIKNIDIFFENSNPTPINPVLIEVSPTSLISQTYSVKTQISAFRGTQNVLQEISCSPSSSIQDLVLSRIDIENSELIVTRTTNEALKGSIICSSSSQSDSIIIPLEFLEIDMMSIITLRVPNKLDLGTSVYTTQEISAFENSVPISNEIICQSSSSSISLEASHLGSTSQLNIQRLSNDSIRSVVTCNVRGISKSFEVLFDETRGDIMSSLFVNFPGEVQNLGQSSGATFYINAQSIEGVDVTNRVVCESLNSRIKISPALPQTLNLEGKLQVSRISNESISGNINCMVSDGVNEESKRILINFDKITLNKTIDDPESLKLRIDTQRSNLITNNEPYSFSSGNLVFTLEPEVVGSYRLYMNGELVKTVTYPTLEITLSQEDYLNLGLSGEFEVEARDNVGSSNSIRMRFIRTLGAIVTIIVS
ncbi:MAG: hypothetical protein LAT82_01250 [Nanoarchaeota archaeon]|nr:hypothetical protein [Nanoarchaeota archaeon]